jgi:hypothetical protein
LLILVLMMPVMAQAQQDVAEAGDQRRDAGGSCSAPEYRQFDFWIGDWNVTSNGEPAGTNSITAVHGGCALTERWQGAGEGGISGSSFNIYDQATSRWHQTWVDSTGTLLQLDGGLVGGTMVLSGERVARDGSGMVLHRISWTPGADGSVRQLWEASKDGGENWTVVFDGRYQRASNRR